MFPSGSGTLRQINKHKYQCFGYQCTLKHEKWSLRKTCLQFRRYHGDREFDFLYQWLCYNYRTCLPNTDTMMQDKKHQSNELKNLSLYIAYKHRCFYHDRKTAPDVIFQLLSFDVSSYRVVYELSYESITSHFSASYKFAASFRVASTMALWPSVLIVTLSILRSESLYSQYHPFLDTSLARSHQLFSICPSKTFPNFKRNKTLACMNNEVTQDSS